MLPSSLPLDEISAVVSGGDGGESGPPSGYVGQTIVSHGNHPSVRNNKDKQSAELY